MIRELKVSNYKSIDELSLSLGTMNVFIGENGAGKSNILEAIALAGAAHADKLDNEFLSARGVRVTSAKLMRAAFENDALDQPISLTVQAENDQKWTVLLSNDNKPFSSWQRLVKYDADKDNPQQLIRLLKAFFNHNSDTDAQIALLDNIKGQLEQGKENLKNNPGGDRIIKLSLDVETDNDFTFSLTSDETVSSFLIYSPEDSALRAFDKIGQIEPLGLHGEGLFRLLKVMMETEKDRFDIVQDNLQMLGWFDRLSINSDSAGESIDITDVYLSELSEPIDQRSANEGFLYLAFYFALFSSDLTPKFFAIDNIDASLNPRLCRELIRRLTVLAKQFGKQVIVTSHSAAILDGLDINDDEQRLFVIYRNDDGKTRSNRVAIKPKVDGEKTTRLSELFMRGMIGGLPKGF